VKPTPVKDPAALGLVRVKVSDVAAFGGIFAVPKTSVIAGAVAETVSVAFDVLPVPPSVEVICTLLFFTPGATPRTVTTIVHEVPGASVAPDRLAEVAPAVAVALPPQLFVNPFGVATTSPAGRLSVKASPVSDAPVLGLPTVKVSDVVPLVEIVVEPNTFVIVGGKPEIVSDAFDVLPMPPLVEVTCTLLFFTPSVVPVTFTTIVHEVFAARPTNRLTEEAPATAVAVPPQLFVNPLGEATTSPAGRLSVKAI